MSEIHFEAPPPGRNGGHQPATDHRAVAATLRERPGEWALIRRAGTQGSAGSTARLIKRGALLSYAPPGSFEAVSRAIDGEFRIYARYIGHLNEGTT
ncbi:hypothetical protein HY68_01365 [Streptomyces sp. AcH 505]|uniref:hypothetical protein n=1 Tax=Streptomyces sp. AcH 505 TaxID=352211 RepID=UPI0005923B19|nr:hypothetical protein HY68_01365 [Streptomyces sp. AcH 505]